MTALSRPAVAGLFAGTVLSCLALSMPAQAVPFSGTLTYGGGTNQSYTPGGPLTWVTGATSLTEGTDQQILTLTGTPGAPGQLGGLLHYATQILNIPVAASGTLGGMSLSWGVSDRFSFTAVSGSYLRDTVNHALNFLWLGTFHDTFGAFNTQVAQFTQGWSQASDGQLPNVGGTMNSDPTLALPVPEPASLALFGVGLLGLAVVTRRKSRTTAV